jgi:DNA-directed RNA polymerase subunit RPC12/RpoP
MDLLIDCTRCQRKLKVTDSLIGKAVKCPLCGEVVMVRAAAPAPPAPAAPPPPPTPSPAIGSEQRKTAPTSPPTPPKPAAAPEPQPLDFAEQPHDTEPAGEQKAISGFKLVVKSDPEKKLKGRFDGRVTSEGLRLRQASRNLLIPVGAPVQYLGGNRFSAELDSRTVQFVVMGFFSYQNRMTRDLVSHLTGEGKVRPPKEYALPWYFLVPVLLPIGIAFIAIIGLGGLLWGGLGGALAGGLVAASFAIVQRENWPVAVRLLLSLALSAIGYGGLIAVLLVGFILSRFNIGNWQTFTSEEGRFSVQMPGKPQESTENQAMWQVHIFSVVRPAQDLGFFVHYYDLTVEKPDVNFIFRNNVRAQLPKGNEVKEQNITLDGFPGREFTVEAANHVTVIRRAYIVKKRVYLVTVSSSRLQSYQGDVQKFFDSFKVTKVP